MKIEYEKIIEAANRRKESLQRLETVLQPAESALDMLEDSLHWLKRVKDAMEALDPEGKEMVPKDLRGAFSQIESRILPYYGRMVVGVNDSTSDIHDLRVALGIVEAPNA